MNAAHAHMAARSGPDPILESVDVQGTIRATLATIRMAQTYRNLESSSIEIVYTFPLPPQATLLDVVVELNGERYRGAVFARSQAEEKYEDAIAEGNTALMVERPEPGLYVMNLGNLMGGESVKVEVEFAMLLDWRRNQLRLSLPMTLAPRFGQPALQPHQIPTTDILVERPFSLSLNLSDELASAAISSPTHPIATRVRDGVAQVLLKRREAWMDRDFVLNVEAADVPIPFACVVKDGDDEVAYASFQIPPSSASRPSRDVKIVLDCSGSMAGDSIALARAGVLKLLDKLRPEDRFGLVAFGSEPLVWKPTMQPAVDLNLEAASAWVRGRNADLGGTEMVAALEAARRIRGAGDQCDVFLVTDGQIARTDELTRFARRVGHRVFVIGIGSAPQQAPLKILAEETGGALDCVTPGEAIAESIHRMFSRVIELPVTEVRLQGSSNPEWDSRTPARVVFSGDTIHLFRRAGRIEGPLGVEWEMPDGEARSLQLYPRLLSTNELAAVPRVAASLRIRDLVSVEEDSPIAEQLAVKYQLVTAQSNYLIVIDREDARARTMPEIRQVPQMLPAGWGGVGRLVVASQHMRAFSAGDQYVDYLSIDDDVLLRKLPKPDRTVSTFVSNASKYHAALIKAKPLVLEIAVLHELGLPEALLEVLTNLAARNPESDVVLAFWTVMFEQWPAQALSRGLLRSMMRAGVPGAARPELVRAIAERCQVLA